MTEDENKEYKIEELLKNLALRKIGLIDTSTNPYREMQGQDPLCIEAMSVIIQLRSQVDHWKARAVYLTIEQLNKEAANEHH